MKTKQKLKTPSIINKGWFHSISNLRMLLVLSLLCTTVALQAQEVCGDGIDNDGDSLIDCADPDITCLDDVNLLTNGDFETAGGCVHRIAGQSFGGWTVTNQGASGGCDALFANPASSCGMTTYAGVGAVDLQSNSSGGNASCNIVANVDQGIEQAITTEVGEQYRVDLYALHTGGAIGGSLNSLQVYVDGGLISSYTLTTSWQLYTTYFTATSTSTAVRFVNKANTFSVTGIDEISVVKTSCAAVPEICGDGLDNDFDGLLDNLDTDCTPNCSVPIASTGPTTGFSLVIEQAVSGAHSNNAMAYTGDFDNDGNIELLGMNSAFQWVVTDMTTGTVDATFTGYSWFAGNSRAAVADIDGDGFAEYIIESHRGRPAVHEHDGTLKWRTPTTDIAGDGRLGVADFNQDGIAEIYNNQGIWDVATGSLIAEVTSGSNGFRREIALDGGVGIAADVLPGSECTNCGGLELVVGHSIFAVDITGGTLTEVRDLSGRGVVNGVDAVADWDNDGDLDVVIQTTPQSGGMRIVVWDVINDVILGQTASLGTSILNSHSTLLDIVIQSEQKKAKKAVY